MPGAIFHALSQMFSRSFRAVLFKSVGTALALLIVLGIALQRLLAAALKGGAGWTEAAFPWLSHAAVEWIQFGMATLASLGLVAGLVFLMPAVSAFVASFFADEIAAEVERTGYPADAPGTPLPVGRALLEGLKTALLALVVYLCAVPFLLVAGLGVVIFFFATAFLLGREYFELAAMRFHAPAAAKALRKRHAGQVFLGGMAIAFVVSIPIVNLVTPLFGTALMVHIHKRLAESRR